MMKKPFPVIDPVATGANIVRLREDRGLTVRDLQTYFGFEEIDFSIPAIGRSI